MRGLRCGLAGARWRIRRQVKLDAEVRRVVDAARPEWTNTTVLSGAIVDEVTKLKKEQDGDITDKKRLQLSSSTVVDDGFAIQVYTGH